MKLTRGSAVFNRSANAANGAAIAHRNNSPCANVREKGSALKALNNLDAKLINTSHFGLVAVSS